MPIMINAAIRNNSGNSHPYIGGGIGFALASADVTFSGTGTIGGEPFGSGSVDDDDTAFAGQLFIGFDYDVVGSLYLGINGRYFLMDAELFGADVEFRTWSVMGIVGFRF